MAIPYGLPVRTVDKFGVSINRSQGQGPIAQPKMKHRWRVLFLGFGDAGRLGEAMTLNAQSVQLPTLQNPPVEVHSYNSRAYYAGKHEWNSVSLTVRDSVDNTVMRELGRQSNRILNHYTQVGYRAAGDYKFDTQIQLLEGNHDFALITWTLEGCFFESINFGDVDYTNGTDFVTIEMTLRYDNAVCEDESGQYSVMTFPTPDPRGNTL